MALCVHANGGQTLLTGGAHVEGGLDDQQPLAHCVEGKEQGVWPLERGEHKLLINQSRRGFFCQPMTGSQIEALCYYYFSSFVFD